MSLKAGALLWNRTTVAFAPNANSVEVDTGIIQENKSFDGMSPNEPGLDVRTIVVANGPDITIGSRVQVIPVSPYSAWTNIIHGEPFVDATTNTVHVVFIHSGLVPEPPFQFPPFNVLFWDPHSVTSPGQADTYNPPD